MGAAGEAAWRTIDRTAAQRAGRLKFLKKVDAALEQKDKQITELIRRVERLEAAQGQKPNQDARSRASASFPFWPYESQLELEVTSSFAANGFAAKGGQQDRFRAVQRLR